MSRRALIAFGAWLAITSACPDAWAAAVASPVASTVTGPVILTVTGLDPAQFADGRAEFDLTSLAAMGPVQITTSSIWTDGKHTYTGVPLKSLARSLHLDSQTVSLHAINDYTAEIPLSEAEDAAPILAYLMDGAPMSVRDKGPIWVIYPYDANASYRSDTTFARSVWQLDRIDVLR